MKTCTRCGTEYRNPQLHFSKKKDGRNGLRAICKVCDRKQVKTWTKANPEQKKARDHRHRVRKRSGAGTYTAQQWQTLKEKYNFTCLACGRREPEIKLTVDHILPVSKGGSNNIDNIQPLCGSCNSSKKDTFIDYRRKYEGKKTDVILS